MNCDSSDCTVESDGIKNSSPKVLTSELREELQTENAVDTNNSDMVLEVKEQVSCLDVELRQTAENSVNDTNEITKTSVAAKENDNIEINAALQINKDNMIESTEDINNEDNMQESKDTEMDVTVQVNEGIEASIPQQTNRNLKVELAGQINEETNADIQTQIIQDSNADVESNDDVNVVITNNEDVDAEKPISGKSEKIEVDIVPAVLKKEVFESSALYRLSAMYGSDTDSENEPESSNVTVSIEAECVSSKSLGNVTDLQSGCVSPVHSTSDTVNKIKVSNDLSKPTSSDMSSVNNVLLKPANSVVNSIDESTSSSDSDSSLFEENSDSDDSEQEPVKNKFEKPTSKSPFAALHPIKAKGELTIDDLPRIEDLHISVPEGTCKELGKVYSIVQKLVVVEPDRSIPTLNLDTVLFLDKGKRALGHIFDVFGKVSEPYYCVRFNSTDHIKEFGVEVGTIVYCAPMNTSYTHYVFLKELQSKGSDASWKADVEPPENLLEYSDDEEERKANMNRRHQKKNATQDTLETPPTKKMNISFKNSNRNVDQNGTSEQTCTSPRTSSRKFNDNSRNFSVCSTEHSNSREVSTSVKTEPFETSLFYNSTVNNNSQLQQHSNISSQFRTKNSQFGGEPNFRTLLKPPTFYAHQSIYNEPPPLCPRPEHLTQLPPTTHSQSSLLHLKPPHLPERHLQSQTPTHIQPPPLLPPTHTSRPTFLSPFSLTPVRQPPPSFSNSNMFSLHSDVYSKGFRNISQTTTSSYYQPNYHSINSNNNVSMFRENTGSMNDRNSTFRNAADNIFESSSSSTQNMFQPSTFIPPRRPASFSNPQIRPSNFTNSLNFPPVNQSRHS